MISAGKDKLPIVLPSLPVVSVDDSRQELGLNAHAWVASRVRQVLLEPLAQLTAAGANAEYHVATAFPNNEQIPDSQLA